MDILLQEFTDAVINKSYQQLNPKILEWLKLENSDCNLKCEFEIYGIISFSIIIKLTLPIQNIKASKFIEKVIELKNEYNNNNESLLLKNYKQIKDYINSQSEEIIKYGGDIFYKIIKIDKMDLYYRDKLIVMLQTWLQEQGYSTTSHYLKISSTPTFKEIEVSFYFLAKKN